MTIPPEGTRSRPAAGEVRASASAGRAARGLPGAFVRLVHPFPSLLVTMVVGGLACVAAGGWPGAWRLLSLMGTMLLIQFAIGVFNDWADRDLDRLSRPRKPVANGQISPRTALIVGCALGVCAAALAVTAGPAAALLAMLGLGIGLAYDLGLKPSRWSALTYAVALPLVPVWVWTALGEGSPALVAVLPVGALLGLGLQLINALPDAEADAAAGVFGTLQWLGPARGRRVAWCALALASLLALVLAPALDLRLIPYLPCWLLAVSLFAVAAWLQRTPRPENLRRAWALSAAAAAVLAVGWLASLP